MTWAPKMGRDTPVAARRLPHAPHQGASRGGDFALPGGFWHTHLEGLEGEAHVEALGDGDLPDAHLAGPVVVGVVGGLDVPVVLLHVPPADGCKGGRTSPSLSSHTPRHPGGPPKTFFFTFVDGEKAFAHPVAAAAELDPEAAVGGDDGLGQLVAAEPAWG